MSRDAPIVVCGAGVAGVAAAYHLAALHGARRVTLVDPLEPLTGVSARSLEGYRAWFPDPVMTGFMGRSVALLDALVEESGGGVRMNRRGYVLLTRDRDRLAAWARESSAGGVALRRHPGPAPYVPADPVAWQDAPDGADLIEDPALVRRLWSYVAPDVAGALHVRRAGFHDAWGAGQWMLMRAARAGVQVRRARVRGFDAPGGRVRGVALESGDTLPADHVVLATGPALGETARWLDLALPVYRERHVRAAWPDTDGLLPREAPLLVWSDPVMLERPGAERRAMGADPEAAAWLRPLEGGIKVRPRERPHGILAAWTYDGAPHAADTPTRPERHAAAALYQAAAEMLPALGARMPDGAVADGADCLRTPDDRPLVGPLPVEGAWALGALSGYGLMGAHAAADLLAAHLLGHPLPGEAPSLSPARDAGPVPQARGTDR